MDTRSHAGIGRLITAVQELSMARDVEAIQAIVRSAARALCGADGATFVLRDGEHCYYADEDAIEPLWKGQRFPLELCISGWSMLNRQPAVIPDIYADDRIPHEAYRPTFVRSLVMVPIRELDPVGAIGNYWADHHHATDEEVELLQALANSVAVAMENVAVYQELEHRVAERTIALQAVNDQLAAEVEERRRAEDEVRRLSLTDELTGLYNRRGFLLLAGQEQLVAQRAHRRSVVLFVDVDGLKPLNDEHGHEAGDECLRLVAGGLRAAFREGDVVARLAGDEFAVFVVDTDAEIDELVDRSRTAMRDIGFHAGGRAPEVSIGAATLDPSRPRSIDELLAAADDAMYVDKRSRRVS